VSQVIDCQGLPAAPDSRSLPRDCERVEDQPETPAADEKRSPALTRQRSHNATTRQLGYAVHVYKAQGITAEASGIPTGGWQTDKEHAYVVLSRAREQTKVYVAREDLGEAGMDVGAMERLGERMRRSGAQEASIAREVDEQAVERQVGIEREIDRDQELGRGFGIG
jgi:hypothetical protein